MITSGKTVSLNKFMFSAIGNWNFNVTCLSVPKFNPEQIPASCQVPDKVFRMLTTVSALIVFDKLADIIIIKTK